MCYNEGKYCICRMKRHLLMLAGCNAEKGGNHMKKGILLSAAVCTASFTVGLMPPQSAAAAGTDLYVGYSGRSGNYASVQAAVDAAAQINPKSENERVTIHIAPGTYREQITVTTPYLSFVNDTPEDQVLLTWYYGIGYQYYSVSADGVYSADAARAKTEKHEPTQRWGCSVRVRSNATAFRAESITFENSFNRYVTDAELADGVSLSGSQKITFQRYKGADVQSKAATERAAAIAIEANYSEFLDCTFMSSQDTLFLGSQYGYFKDCLIEGNTDYIFGSGTYVFDTCELRFKGYSGSAAGGYITANKNAGKTLFTNCAVTAASGMSVSAGFFGRPWGNEADVAFVNTKLQYEGIIQAAGWTQMSNNPPENAKFKEYGTTVNGRGVNTSGRVRGTVCSSADGLDTQTYLGSWVPYYLNGGPVEIPAVSGKLVQDLKPVQPGYSWKIHENVQTGDVIFTDRDFTFIALPEQLKGGEAVVTPCDGKLLSGSLAEFTAAEDVNVSVLLDTRVEHLPDWLADWTKTDLSAETSNDVLFAVYQKTFAAGEQVTLGENGQSSYCINYTVIVQQDAKQTLPGDADCNGILNAKDLTLCKRHLLVPDTLSGTALANADWNGDGHFDSSDPEQLAFFLTH